MVERDLTPGLSRSLCRACKRTQAALRFRLPFYPPLKGCARPLRLPAFRTLAAFVVHETRGWVHQVQSLLTMPVCRNLTRPGL